MAYEYDYKVIGGRMEKDIDVNTVGNPIDLVITIKSIDNQELIINQMKENLKNSVWVVTDVNGDII